MPVKKRSRAEIWILAILFFSFVAFAALYDRIGQEKAPRDAPSAYNNRARGTKALSLLLKQMGYSVSELRRNWPSLTDADRLVVVIEPLDPERSIGKQDLQALRGWVERGGTLLYLVSVPPRPLDDKDPLFGNVAIVKGDAASEKIDVDVDSPYLHDVGAIQAAAAVRLKPKDDGDYETLLEDKDGALILHKTVGKGHALIVADSRSATNDALRQYADNALFFVNVAKQATGTSRGEVLFDEYHQGFGYSDEGDTQGLLAALPGSFRLALWHGIGLFGLIVYNGNRRFGRPKQLPPVTYRSSTDYIGSMARLYRRATAADIALLTVYKAFLRDLTRAVNASPDAPPSELTKFAIQRFGPEIGPGLTAVIARCEAIAAGQRIGEAEMLSLTRQLDQIRRRWELVGTG